MHKSYQSLAQKEGEGSKEEEWRETQMYTVESQSLYRGSRVGRQRMRERKRQKETKKIYSWAIYLITGFQIT